MKVEVAVPNKPYGFCGCKATFEVEAARGNRAAVSHFRAGSSVAVVVRPQGP